MLGLITESQHGRGWQGPLWVTQSNPLPKQGHPEQAAQDLVKLWEDQERAKLALGSQQRRRASHLTLLPRKLTIARLPSAFLDA